MKGLYKVEQSTITIGRLNNCSIACEDIAEMSGTHLKIISSGTNNTITVSGKNGVYINSRFISLGEKVLLKYGDLIEMFSVRLLWLDSLIAIDSERNIRTTLNLYADSEREVSWENVISYGDEKRYFTKAPRTYYSLNTETVELEAPPERHVDEKQSVFLTIGPAFTMAIPMILGFLVSRMASKSGGAGAFMYTGVVTALSSAFFGIIWAASSIKNRRSQLIQNEKKRRTMYIKYVNDSEARIKEIYNKNSSYLHLMYPFIYEYVRDEINRFMLWNRNVSDEDFLRIRIGLGDVPFDVNISVPKERFSLAEDKLKDLPRRLKKTYSVLKDVPQTVDLIENKCVGIVSDSVNVLNETFILFLINIGVSISPNDVSISFAFFKNYILDDSLRAIRFLPHLSSTNTEYHIIFTDSFEKVISEKSNTIYIVLSDHFENLPSDCRLIIQRERNFSGYLKISTENSIRRSIYFDKVSVNEAERISRLLQGVEFRRNETEYDLPKQVSFFELYEKCISTEQIIENWRSNNSIDEINARIGIGEDGNVLTLDLHERKYGPHGLIGGMTGSGKSELLQAIILSLIINYSPEYVGFFMIDYKGGGMASLFNNVPHVMGSISNLSGRTILRAMVSVKSENERRQRKFNEASVNNISEYQRLYKDGFIKEPLPHIFIIIDEFAELKKEEPDFMKELISVARVGRSLGVHLILATQKPSGVVDDNIFSNSRFRICLRLQDRSDSMEMIKRPVAANITNPGRAYLQVGNNEVFLMFQGAYTMDKSKGNSRKKTLNIYEPNGKKIEVNNGDEDLDTCEETQLNRVLALVNEATEQIKPNRGSPLWLKPLQENIYYKSSGENRRPFDICIGIYDDPAHQTQGELIINLVQSGNLIIIGSLLSGKSTLMATISYSLLNNIQNDFVCIYILDFSRGHLRPFKDAFFIGGYICEENEEDIEKLFILINELIVERKEKLVGGDFRQSRERINPVILMIDGIGAFREKTSGAFDKEIDTILKTGESLGIFVIASAISVAASEVTKRMFDNFPTCIPLCLKDKYEYKEVLRTPSNDITVPPNIRGRGLAKVNNEIVEFQAFLPVMANDDFERNELIEKKVKEVNIKLTASNWTGEVRRLPYIPKELNLQTFMEEIRIRTESKEVCEKDGIPIGFFKRSGKIATIPINEVDLVIISGRPNSGRHNLLRLINEFGDGKVKAYIYDEKMPFEELSNLKKEISDDPFVIHMGGAIDRQNIADFSYIPYSEQIKTLPAGIGTIRKTLRGNEHGTVIIPIIE